MKAAAFVVVVLLAFLTGYALCSYRAYGVLYPELFRSERVSSAALFVRYIDLIDQGDTARLRAILAVTARIDLGKDPPSATMSWQNFLTGPFERSADVLAYTHSATDTTEAGVRSALAKICASPPNTNSYHVACGS